MVTGPSEVAETENPATDRSVDADAGDIRFQFEEVVLNDVTVFMEDAVATAALLLVSTVGPLTPIVAMAADRLLKSDESALDKLLIEDVMPVNVV